MISLLHIIGSKKLGGAEKFYTRLVNALYETKHDISVTLPPDSELIEYLNRNVTKHHCKMRSAFDPVSHWQINHIIKKLKPDIVQTYMGRATRLTHIRPGKGPVHVARLGGFYNLKAYRHAHAWVGNTKAISDYLVKNGMPADRVFHIGNFVDDPVQTDPVEIKRIKRKFGIDDGRKVLLSVGRLHENKAFDTLLKAIGILAGNPASIDFVLVIVGDGPEREKLHRFCEELNLSERIVWTGWQDPAPFYQMADLFVCSSRHEPLGNVILEAWSHKLAVITTKTQGPMEFADPGENAILVDIDNSAELAAEIDNCIRQDEILKSLGDHGKKKTVSEFSRQKIVHQYMDMYRTLTDNQD